MSSSVTTSRSEHARHLLVRVDVGPKAGAGEDDVADEHEVALALVAVLGPPDGETVALEPTLVQPFLAAPLGMPEARQQRDPVDDERAVGGEHHVRQAPLGPDGLDHVARLLVGGAEPFPLLGCEPGVGRQLGVHPGS